MTTSDHITYCIYRIVNFQNGKVYVGQTLNYKLRKNRHLHELKHGKHDNQHLQAAWNKYGNQSFYFELLERNVSENDINEREVYWIAYFNSFHNGYNKTPGGQDRQDLCIPCIWNEIKYPSINAAARANGISSYAMGRRIKNGYKCDDDVFTREKSCTWNGIKYSSILDAAHSNGISAFAMGNRINQGYTSDVDLKRNNVKKICIWNNVQYPSISHAAKELGISDRTMRTRIRRKHKCDAGLKIVKKKCVWNNIEYSTIAEAAEANNISAATMSRRLATGLICDADLNHSKDGNSCVWNGIQYQSTYAAAKANNVTRGTMRYWIAHNWHCDNDVICRRKNNINNDRKKLSV